LPRGMCTGATEHSPCRIPPPDGADGTFRKLHGSPPHAAHAVNALECRRAILARPSRSVSTAVDAASSSAALIRCSKHRVDSAAHCSARFARSSLIRPAEQRLHISMWNIQRSLSWRFARILARLSQPALHDGGCVPLADCR
jgi:hypothetical protein